MISGPEDAVKKDRSSGGGNEYEPWYRTNTLTSFRMPDVSDSFFEITMNHSGRSTMNSSTKEADLYRTAHTGVYFM